MTVQDALKTRIDLLQAQIDRAIKSGETHNAVGLPMPEQIEMWKKMIKKAEKQIEDR